LTVLRNAYVVALKFEIKTQPLGDVVVVFDD
jgi:hypothetical protein